MPRPLRIFAILALIALPCAACSKSDDKKSSSKSGGDDDDEGEVVEEFDGKAKIDGEKVKIAHCKAVKGDQDHEALEITLGDGTKIKEDQLTGLTVDGKKVECSKHASSTTGGTAGDKRWVKGKLGLDCDTKKGELELEVKYDCGSKSRPSNLKD